MKAIPLDEAAALIPNGATLMIGGFMGVGTPEPLVDELVRQEKHDLTVIANDTASPGIGIGKLVRARPPAQSDCQPYRSQSGNPAADDGRALSRWTSCRKEPWSSASGPAAAASVGF